MLFSTDATFYQLHFKHLHRCSEKKVNLPKDPLEISASTSRTDVTRCGKNLWKTQSIKSLVFLSII